MDLKILLIIIGMSLVTYISRALPVIVLGKIRIPKKVEDILKAIPYAALGALIFPGILSVNTAHPIVGAVGGGVAVILAFAKLNITCIICGAVAVTVCLQLFFI